MSEIFPPIILGLEMAASTLWRLAFLVFVCWRTSMPINFLVLGGGGFGFWDGGVEVPILFTDTGIFLIHSANPEQKSEKVFVSQVI